MARARHEPARAAGDCAAANKNSPVATNSLLSDLCTLVRIEPLLSSCAQRAGELPAVVDQRANEAEEAAGAAGCVRTSGWPIVVGIRAAGLNGGVGRGGHERDKNIGGGAVARNIFLEQLQRRVGYG